jgi:hypothetical protein
VPGKWHCVIPPEEDESVSRAGDDFQIADAAPGGEVALDQCHCIKLLALTKDGRLLPAEGGIVVAPVVGEASRSQWNDQLEIPPVGTEPTLNEGRSSADTLRWEADFSAKWANPDQRRLICSPVMHELTLLTSNDFQVADLRPFGKATLDQRYCIKLMVLTKDGGLLP